MDLAAARPLALYHVAEISAAIDRIDQMKETMVNKAVLQSLHLYHYYECALGPFVNLSDLPFPEAEQILARIRQAGHTFASTRAPDYLTIRYDLEDRVRRLFHAKGGQPRRIRPHYMTVGACSWLRTWYTQSCELCIPLDTFAPDTLSFTYGDMFPALRLDDGRPYRGQVYLLTELPALIEQYGLPQGWNVDGQHGPERYIEAHIWDDTPLQPYLKNGKGIVCHE